MKAAATQPKNSVSVAAALLLVTLSVGCNNEDPPATNETARVEPATAEAPNTTLTGVVLRKEWTKTMESWNAGGSHYFVFDVGDTPVQHRTADEGVLLLATKDVTDETFEQYVGKTVQVAGDYFAGSPIELEGEDEYSQRPADLSDNDLRGAGFKVATIALAGDNTVSGKSD